MANFWQDRPVFVTGATGLVGGWLVKRLFSPGLLFKMHCAALISRSLLWFTIPNSLVRLLDIAQPRVIISAVT